MNEDNNSFSNPATVVLMIEPGIPVPGEDIFTYPEHLPALPQVGHLISMTVPGRSCRYLAKVADVVFCMDIEDGTGMCRTRQVEIHCNLIDRQRLP